MRRHLPLLPALVLGAMLPAGCKNGNSLEGVAPGDIPTDLTDPAAVIESFGTAWNTGDLESYMALLEAPPVREDGSGFSFRVAAGDSADFGWLEGGSWGLAVERTLVGRAFAADASAATDLELTILSRDQPAPGLEVLHVDAALITPVGSSDGWRTDTRLVFTLAEQADGFLRIRSIRESVPLRADGSRVPSGGSWAFVKASHRKPTEVTRPEALVDVHRDALQAKDLVSYLAVLDPGFLFHIRDDDAADFPWLDGTSWGLGVESTMRGHMVDPAYSGNEPPVQSIAASFGVFQRQETGGGRFELAADAALTVLISPADGWRSDTRFLFDLATGSDGFLVIGSIREVARLAPGRAGSSAVETSWGSIKALYH